MDKQTRDKIWQTRISTIEKMRIVLLAKLLGVSRSEAVRQAVQKMLAEESIRKLQK